MGRGRASIVARRWVVVVEDAWVLEVERARTLTPAAAGARRGPVIAVVRFAVAALAAAAGPSPTERPAIEVEWSAPPECPDRQALLDGIERRGGRPLEPGSIRVVARTVAVGPRRYRMDLALEIGERRDARVLHARRCDALVDAAALRIAVAIAPEGATPPPEVAAIERGVDGPDAPLEPSTGPGAPEPEAPPEPELEPPSPEPPLDPLEPLERPLDRPVDLRDPEEAPEARPVEPIADDLGPSPSRRRRVPGGFLRLHGLGELGALPGATGGFGLAGGLLWARARLEVQATYLAPRTITRAEAEVRAALVAGSIHGCARVGRGRLEVPLCGGLEVGGMPGRAVGPGVDGAALGRWIAGVVTVGASWRLTPQIALWGAVQGLAAAERAVFLLRDPGPEVVLFDPGVLSGRLALGVELRFGDPRRGRGRGHDEARATRRRATSSHEDVVRASDAGAPLVRSRR